MTLGSHLLGRIEPPDMRHVELHPLRAALVRTGVEVTIPAPTLSDYNQGQTPKCVGYSTSRVVNWLNRFAFSADWLYDQCKRIDPWPGEDGTSARYACDVLRAQGHLRIIGGNPVKAGPQKKHGIESNTWATSVDDIRSVFAAPKPQPVLMGTEWLEAWFNPELRGREWWFQDPRVAGGSAGGHEWGIWACSDNRQAFGMRNTWGRDFPPLVWVPYSTIDFLFGAGADACVLHDLPTR
jgi:hypothetical protein